MSSIFFRPGQKIKKAARPILDMLVDKRTEKNS